MKNQYIVNWLKRGDDRGGGVGQFTDLREGLAKKTGVVFLRGFRYTNAHYGQTHFKV